uniref:C2H2-type domain-containing protein n=1 Tax=Guillardia theta TaxID=55529 RepID=A0A7S4JPZ1_GUITH
MEQTGQEGAIVYECTKCKAAFPSKNQLFKHIRTTTCTSKEGEEEEEEKREQEVVIYVVGGRDRGNTLGVVEIFSSRSGTWEKYPHMLEQRGSHGVAAVGQEIFAFSGGGIESNLGTCEKFDPKEREWKFVAPMQTKRHALAAVSDGRRIFASGGWEDGSKCTPTMESYDPQEDRWSRCADMLVPRRLHGMTHARGSIFVFGGASDDKYEIKSAEVYDISKDSWCSLPDMPVASYASAATLGDKIFVFLWGKSVLHFDTEQRVYTKVCKLPLDEWYGFAISSHAQRAFLIGGATKGRWTNRGFVFDARTSSWEELPSMGAVRRRCCAVAVEANGPGGR